MKICHKSTVWRVVVFAAIACGALSIATSAEACSLETEHVREIEPYASRLSDCRAYEQVSPVDKNTTDADGKPGFVHSSPSGNSVTYYSVVPFPGIPSSSEFPTYLSMRKGTGWSTQGLLPPVEPGVESEISGQIEDNEQTILTVDPEQGPPLAPGAEAGHFNAYIHDNVTGEYKLLGARVGSIEYDDSTPDGAHIIFTSTGHELVPGIVNEDGEPYLYEWERETGQLSFVGVVGDKAPEGGTVAGSNENREALHAYDQNTISDNGSRIFFSEVGENKQVYMREPNTERTLKVSGGLAAAQWRTATPDGSKAFYTEGGNLYQFNVEAATSTAITMGASEVLGMLGISSDGSYAYFVAKGVLTTNENGDGKRAEAGEANLYEWHEDSSVPITFIATLNKGDDGDDWNGLVDSGHLTEGADQGYKDSRVSPDGMSVLISSVTNLTAYNSDGNQEIYLYNTAEPLSKVNPRCVSCNPTGAVAHYEVSLSKYENNSAPVFSYPFATRNLSIEGARVFFQTAEPLALQATDGQENVYEWEKEGAGSCGIGEGTDSGGCLFLISTGQSINASYFGDASESGGDVFFFTRQSLVSQDQDENIDVYDARENGGLQSQNPMPARPCEGEECRSASALVPALGRPYSIAIVEVGSPPPPVEEKLAGKTPKLSSRTQRLKKALRACGRERVRRREHCRAQAEKKYGSRAKKSDRGGK
jgi:hypothetical protein